MKFFLPLSFALMGSILWIRWTQATDPVATPMVQNPIPASPPVQTSKLSDRNELPAQVQTSAVPTSSPIPVTTPSAALVPSPQNLPPGSVMTTTTTTTTTIGPTPLGADKNGTPSNMVGPMPSNKDKEDGKIIHAGSETGSSLIIQSEIQNKNEVARASIQDYMNIRDPFRSPEIQSTVQGNISQLEKYIITEYKLTGVMTGPIRMRAMIQTPDGKTHFVSEGIKLGNRGGTIRKITTKSVIVRERSVNALGEEEFTTTEILMTPDSNSLAGK